MFVCMLILHIYVSRVFNASKKFLRSPALGVLYFPMQRKYHAKVAITHCLGITTERLFSPYEIRDSIHVLGLLNLRMLKSQISRVNYFFPYPRFNGFSTHSWFHHFILCEHKMFSQGFQLTCSKNIPVTSFESRSLWGRTPHHCISF